MSQFSRNLAVLFENELIQAENDEIREERELRDSYESDCECNVYASTEEVEEVTT